MDEFEKKYRFKEDEKTIASAVHLSDIVAHAMQLGNSGEDMVPPMDEDAWGILAISEESFHSLLPTIDKQIKETSEIFLD